mmetsp:Transcript_21094/g.44314  ORF Transcript_21094/g.44314 Transcript_21094/m.44314 type:complete len:86 (-) Transcript_21094:124-381(-)
MPPLAASDDKPQTRTSHTKPTTIIARDDERLLIILEDAVGAAFTATIVAIAIAFGVAFGVVVVCVACAYGYKCIVCSVEVVSRSL